MNNVEARLSIIKDSYTSDHQVLFSSYVTSRFSLTFEGLKIKYKDVEAVIKKIMETSPNIKRFDFPISIFYDFYVLESKDCFITLHSYDNKKKVEINYYFHTYEESQEIFNIIKSFEDKDDELFVSIASFFYDSNKQIKATESIKVLEDFNYNSLNYYPFLETEEMFRQFMISDSNILLFCGRPGVGKSKLGDAFMKYLLVNSDVNDCVSLKDSIITEDIDEETSMEIEIQSQEYEGIKVAYVKNEEILAQDLFWNTLKEEEYNLVFLDDLDYALLPRSQQLSSGVELDKNKFISNLLSFTDGIFNTTTVKTKFIITTNREVKDIDTAVLRKGRTFDILQLRELENIEALSIWNSSGLSEEMFVEKFKHGNVLQSDLGSTIYEELKAKEKNVQLNPYVKEDGISLYNNYKNPKKLGL